jgi:hypothetical protein
MITTNVPTPSPPKRRRGRRLARIAHVKGGLADVIRRLEAGEIDARKANALVYAYATLAGVMQSADLERRVAAIEAAQAAAPSDRARLAS